VSTTAYRRPPPVRRLARRRRKYRAYHLSRWATFGLGFLAPLGGWLWENEPLRWAGLAAMAVAGEIVIPAAVLLALFWLPAFLMGGLVPRKWRIAHRRNHGRERCKSAVITAGLERVVHAMDRSRCLYCGITAAQLAALPPRAGKDGRLRRRCLHVDHDKPWVAGFLTVLPNLGLLCDEHNEIKSCWYRERRTGYVWYHSGSRTPERVRMAEIITMTARRRKRSLFRLMRAAWALG
jgi:hypothetical protein